MGVTTEELKLLLTGDAAGAKAAVQDLKQSIATLPEDAQSVSAQASQMGTSLTDAFSKSQAAAGDLTTYVRGLSDAELDAMAAGTTLTTTVQSTAAATATYGNVLFTTTEEVEAATTATATYGSVLFASTQSTSMLTQAMSGLAIAAPIAAGMIVLTQALTAYIEHTGKAALKAEEHAAKQDVINRAIQFGAPKTIQYADAVKYLNEQFERTPAPVDHAKDALEHWNVAVAKGNAQGEAARLMAKAMADATGTVAKELGRLDPETIARALQLLRDKTAESSTAFNEWAHDIGLSSVTVGALKDQVKLEEEQTRKAGEAAREQAQYEKELQHTLEELRKEYDRNVEAVNKVEMAIGYNTHGLRDLGHIGEETKVHVETLREEIERLERSGQFAAAALLKARDSISTLPNVTPQATQALDTVRRSFGTLHDDMMKFVSGMQPGNILHNLFKSGFTSIFGPSGLLTNLMEQGLSKLTQLAWDGVKKIAGFFKNMFGGPDADELAGRDLVAKFQANFSSVDDMINQVGEAVRQAGGTSEEAQALIKAMWDAEKQGAGATEAAIKRVQDALNGVRQAQADVFTTAGGASIPNDFPLPPGAVTQEIPSFDGRTMERVTGAGVALLHPGDVVGVPRPGQLGGHVFNLNFPDQPVFFRDRASMQDFMRIAADTLADQLRQQMPFGLRR